MISASKLIYSIFYLLKGDYYPKPSILNPIFQIKHGERGHKQLTEEERLQHEFQGLRAQLDAERSKSARLEKERGGQEDKCRAGFGKPAAPWECDPCCVYPSSLRATNQGELYTDGSVDFG